MAVAFASAVSNSVSAAPSTGVTVTKPASLANGDVLYAFVSKTTYASTAAFTCSGWTQILTQGTTTGNDRHVTFLRKVITNAAGEPASYTFVTTSGTTSSMCATIIRVTGANNATPENIAVPTITMASNDATPLSRNATTTKDGCLVLSYCILSLGTTAVKTWGPPSGYTNASGSNTSIVANNLNNQHGVAYKTQTTAGAVGTNVWTHTADDATTENGIGVVIVQAPNDVAMTASGTSTSTGTAAFHFDVPLVSALGRAPTKGEVKTGVDPAIKIDATSPVGVSSNTGAVTTASFTPPANSLIVAVCTVGNSTGSGSVTGTITDSIGSGALTYVEGPLIQGAGSPYSYASITVAVDDMVLATSDINGGPQTPTLTKVSGTATVGTYVGVVDEDGAGQNQASIGYLRVTGAGTLVVGQECAQVTNAVLWIITGVDWTDPIGAVASAVDTTNQISPGVTTDRANSLLVVATSEWNNEGVHTSTAYDDYSSGQGGNSAWFHGVFDTAAEGAYSGLIDGFGTGTKTWAWAAVEIHSALPAGEWVMLNRSSASGAGAAEIWAMDAGGSPAARTVTLTGSGANGKGVVLKVYCLTGAKAQASALGATAGANALTAAVTLTTAESMVFFAVSDANGTGAYSGIEGTIVDTQFSDATNGEHYCMGRYAWSDTVPGSLTVGVTGASSLRRIGVWEIEQGAPTSTDGFIVTPGAGNEVEFTADGSSTTEGTATIIVEHPVTAAGSAASSGVATFTVNFIFGTTDASGTSAGGLASTIVSTKYTLTEDGLVVALHYYALENGNVKAAIYADNSGVPGSLIIANNTGTAVTGDQWTKIDITDTALDAGDYWITFLEDQDSMRAWKAGGTNQAAYQTGTPYANGLPSSWTPTGYQSNDYVCYAEYKLSVGESFTADGSSATSGAATFVPDHPVTASGSSSSTGSATFVLDHSVTASGSSSSTGSIIFTPDIPAVFSGVSTTIGTSIFEQRTPVPFTASGVSNSSSIATIITEHLLTGSGLSVTNSSADFTVEHIVVMIGSSNTLGTTIVITERFFYTDSISNETSGTVVAIVEHIVTASGTSTTSGTAFFLYSIQVILSGISTTTGSATFIIEHVVQFIADGTSNTNGSATFIKNVHIIEAKGESDADEDTRIAIFTVEHVVTASGTSSTTGTAIFMKGPSFTAFGASSSTGETSAFVEHVVTISGVATSTGTAIFMKGPSFTASGIASTSGTAIIIAGIEITLDGSSTTDAVATFITNKVVTGEGVNTSTATAIFETNHPVTMDGNSTTEGIATFTSFGPAAFTASGSSTTTGSATFTVTAFISVIANGISTSTGDSVINVDHPITASGLSSTSGTLENVTIDHLIIGSAISSTEANAQFTSEVLSIFSGISTTNATAVFVSTGVNEFAANGFSNTSATAIFVTNHTIIATATSTTSATATFIVSPNITFTAAGSSATTATATFITIPNITFTAIGNSTTFGVSDVIVEHLITPSGASFTLATSEFLIEHYFEAFGFASSIGLSEFEVRVRFIEGAYWGVRMV